MNENISHGSIGIGQAFIEKAKGENQFFTPMQVLKLAYIAHGWMLGICAIPLIREIVEVWPYGPVYPLLYHRIKGYGSSHITADICTDSEKVTLLADAENILNQTYDIYKKYTAGQLSNMTHKVGTPWDNAKKQGLHYIPNEYIQTYYAAKAKSPE